MSGPVELAERALARPLPAFADPNSRRIGTLQAHLHEQERRAARLAALIADLRDDLRKTREKASALRVEIAALQAERAGVARG